MLAAACPARADAPVDLALALVTDVSRSIDDREFALEKDGYRAALTDPRVIAAIANGPNRAIAISYIEFAGGGEVRTVLEWTVLRDAATATAFSDRLFAAERSFSGRTAIGAGIEQGRRVLGEGGPDALRRVIDVCGDGTNNSGPDAGDMRDKAVAEGITINGLAIINDHPLSWSTAHVQPPGGLADYYRRNVAGGLGSFVLEVHAFGDFGDAMRRKLISEIAQGPSDAASVAATR